MQSVLEHIEYPSDIRNLSAKELEILAQELRTFIIDVVARQGGHLGASLGVVELTIALHYALNTPEDLLIWDVGHQAYVHKVLTGRKSVFETNRKYGGISGFPKRSESEYDVFGTGHSSTSISAMLGMATADRLQGVDRQHVAVIGDASMQAGMAFEALNHAGIADTNILVVLNDNRMSIDPSVGALNDFLAHSAEHVHQDPDRIFRQIAGEEKHPETNLFEDLHFQYFGPVDGHDTERLIKAIESLKQIPGPKLLHCVTVKGKGYEPAETGDATKWHAPGFFDPLTGKVLKNELGVQAPKFQDVFGNTLIELAEKNKAIVGVTPAMPTGSSLKVFMDTFPDRAFDVGIAEQHAVTFSAGLAANNILPFCAIYSTFLQRGYDQLIHDVAIQHLKVVFCVDRAGLVGEDGATHHGVYDLAYLRCIPNLIVMSPRNEWELRNMMYTAQQDEITDSVVIRYPRGRGTKIDWQNEMKPIAIPSSEVLNQGDKIAILSVGPMADIALQVARDFAESGQQITVVDMRFIKPLDEERLDEVLKNHTTILTLEDGSVEGGFGSAVCQYAASKRYQGTIEVVGIPDEVVEHGTKSDLYHYCQMDVAGIMKRLHRLGLA